MTLRLRRHWREVVRSAGPLAVQEATQLAGTAVAAAHHAPDPAAVGETLGIIGRDFTARWLHVLIPLDPDSPQDPLEKLPGPYVYCTAVADNATPGAILWTPGVTTGRPAMLHREQVARLVPLWFPTAGYAERYASHVLHKPVVPDPPPEAEAVARALWQAIPIPVRATPVYLPDADWAVSPVCSDGPWVAWRRYWQGQQPRLAVVPPEGQSLRGPWAAFTVDARLFPSAAAAVQGLKRTGLVGRRDPVLADPTVDLRWAITVTGDRRPAPGQIVLSAWHTLWPEGAAFPLHRDDGVHVWQVAQLPDRSAVAWTVDALGQLHVGGKDPHHVWRWDSPAKAFEYLSGLGVYATREDPPVDLAALAPQALGPRPRRLVPPRPKRERSSAPAP